MQNRDLIVLILLCCSIAVFAQEQQPASASQQVEIELSAMECSFPGGKNPAESHPCAYSDIEQLPAKSILLLDRVVASGEAAQRLVARHIMNPAAHADSKEKADAPVFAPGETGTIVETETVVSPDASSCDVNIAYQFRKQLDAKDAATLQEIHFTTSFTAGIDKPVIINVSSVPGHEGTFIAVVARAHLVDSGEGKANADGKPANDAVTSPKK